MNSTVSALKRQHPWLIMMAGPYMSGTGGDPAKIAANRARLESYCLPIYEKGHLAVVGEWFALPIMHAAGSLQHGDSIFEAYNTPSRTVSFNAAMPCCASPANRAAQTWMWRMPNRWACGCFIPWKRYLRQSFRAFGLTDQWRSAQSAIKFIVLHHQSASHLAAQR